MDVKVVSPIFGFENIKEMQLEVIDDFFYVLKAEGIAFTLINPASIREYNVVIPKSYQDMLALQTQEDAKVFNIVTILNPIESSVINFLAPLVLNEKEGLITQVALDENKHKDFSLAEPIGKYL